VFLNKYTISHTREYDHVCFNEDVPSEHTDNQFVNPLDIFDIDGGEETLPKVIEKFEQEKSVEKVEH
jgi:hypothetical protein